MSCTPHCENMQVLREAITEDDDDDSLEAHWQEASFSQPRRTRIDNIDHQLSCRYD